MSSSVPSSDSQTDLNTAASEVSGSEVASSPTPPTTERPPSYVKLAMRNMVRKRGKSLYHFTLTTAGLLALLVGLSYLTR